MLKMLQLSLALLFLASGFVSQARAFSQESLVWKKCADCHLREMRWLEEADAVLATLAKTYPYGQAWKTPSEKPAGSWLILGYEPGKGNYRGQASITAGSNDEYTVQGSLAFADGNAEIFKGEATLYGGHALRTRTTHNGLNRLCPGNGVYRQASSEHRNKCSSAVGNLIGIV